MSNSIARTWQFTIDQTDAISPRGVHFVRPSLMGYANSYQQFQGRHAGKGYFLAPLSLQSVRKTDGAPYSVKFRHNFQVVGTVKMWGSASPVAVDPTCRIGLYEMEDIKGIWRRTSINRAYNMQMVSGTTTLTGSTFAREDYAYATLNSGAEWTVREVLQDIWDNCIPSNNKGTLNFDSSATAILSEACVGVRFHGCSAWDAFCDVCEYYFLHVAYDPWQNAVHVDKFDYSQPAYPEDLHASYDTETFYLSSGIGNSYGLQYPLQIPQKIMVYLPAVVDRGAEQALHREKTNVPYPVWEYEYTTGVTGAVTGTKIPIFDVMRVGLTNPRYDRSLMTDSDYDLDRNGVTNGWVTRASSIAENFSKQLRAASVGRVTVVPIVHSTYPKGVVTSIKIRDYGDHDFGCVTEIITDGSMFPMIERQRSQESFVRDALVHPRIIRALEPQDADVMQHVQVWNGVDNPNIKIDGEAITDGLSYAFPGRILGPRGDGDSFGIPGMENEWEPCWISIAFGGDNASGDTFAGAKDVSVVRNGYSGIGRLAGRLTIEVDGVDETRPYFIIWKNMPHVAMTITAKATTDFGIQDETVQATVFKAHSGNDPSTNAVDGKIPVYNRLANPDIPGIYVFYGSAGQSLFCDYDYIEDRYYIMNKPC